MNKQEKELIGHWSIEVQSPSVANLFSYISYEEYRQQGFLLVDWSRAKPVSQPASRPVVREYHSMPLWSSSFIFSDNGQFTATDSHHQPLPSDGVHTTSTIYSGKWRLEKEMLCLHLTDIKSEGGFMLLQPNNGMVNKTYWFTYRFDGAKLRLFPVFNRADAYESMAALVQESSETHFFTKLEYGLLPILNSSQSKLTAYTVYQVEEKIAEITTNATKEEKNLRFIWDIINRWYKGESGLPVKPFSSKTVDRQQLLGTWYINGYPSNFIHLQHSATIGFVNNKEVILVRNFVPPVPPSVKDFVNESRLELKLNDDGTFYYRWLGFYSQPGDTVHAENTSEYRGTWELEGDLLSLHINEFEQTTDKNHVIQPTKIEGALRVYVQHGNLYAAANIQPDSVYRQMKQAVADAREKNEYGWSARLTPMLIDEHSPLSAYDVWQIDYLAKQIYCAQTNQLKETSFNIQQAYDTIEAIIDKWYTGLIREDK